MTKALKNLALAGALSLATAKCGTQKPETITGNFRGLETAIITWGDSSSRIVMISPGNYLNILSANYNVNGSGIFDNISLRNGKLMVINNEDSVLLSPPDLISQNQSPLLKYANPDSLKAAYDSVITQSKRKRLER